MSCKDPINPFSHTAQKCTVVVKWWQRDLCCFVYKDRNWRNNCHTHTDSLWLWNDIAICYNQSNKLHYGKSIKLGGITVNHLFYSYIYFLSNLTNLFVLYFQCYWSTPMIVLFISLTFLPYLDICWLTDCGLSAPEIMYGSCGSGIKMSKDGLLEGVSLLCALQCWEE